MKKELTIGHWYTQASAGYWQLVDIKDKYATEDYPEDEFDDEDDLDDDEEISWKKGDYLGQWAIVKKAFTPKMKKSIMVECVNASLLKEVSAKTLAEIEDFFKKDGKFKDKYEKTENNPDPFITNMWLCLSVEEAEELQNKLQNLPECFTLAQLVETTQLSEDNIKRGPGGDCNYVLNLLGYPWEFTDTFDPIYIKGELQDF